MKNRGLLAITLMFILTGCLYDQFPSEDLVKFKSNTKSNAQLGQAKFMMDDLGALTLKGLLDVRVMPTKVYETALLLAENGQFPLKSESIPRVMSKYGFIIPKAVANWKSTSGPQPQVQVAGYVKSYIEMELAKKEVLKIQVSSFACAACHSGRTYDDKGLPTNNVWLGSPNTSLDFDGYLGQIYKGLKLAVADNKMFLEKMRAIYPDMDKKEFNSIKRFIMPTVNSEIKKMAAMDRVLPFNNGGPGITNGVGAFKRAARLNKDRYKFNHLEAGYVSIPDINYRGFRSSLTITGSYASTNESEPFREVRIEEAKNPEHLKNLAQLTTLFSYSAMGNTLEKVDSNISNVIDIYNDFLKDSTHQPFPGDVDRELSAQGQVIFSDSCSRCHGDYEGEYRNVHLVNFPNKLIAPSKMGSDNYRWSVIDQSVIKFATTDKTLSKYVSKFETYQGYTPPILSGLWATAPYMHNGSVPDLWSFMNPELRPSKFQLGGHALDYQKMGIAYPVGYEPFSKTKIYDTSETGRSNAGHEGPFKNLDASEKRALLEFLKLL